MQPTPVHRTSLRGCGGLDLARVRAQLSKDYARLSGGSTAGGDAVRLQQTAAALRRIDAGIYGSCASCHHSIGRARLEASPCTTLCVHCQQLAQVHRSA